MRLLICAGGTGGGVYPALTVLQALNKEEAGPVDALWVGGEGGMEADLVKRAGIPFQAIPAAGVHGVGPRALPGNLAKLSRGYLASRRILADFRPQVLFFTGGYLAVPMALAGRKLPSALFTPDIEPGLALKAVAPFARKIAVSVPDSQAYFPRHKGVQVTGYPVRADLGAWTREAAYEALRLSPDLPTLLVSGGSRGARTINQAVLGVLKDLLKVAQVVHLTGQLDFSEVQAAATAAIEPAALAARYRPFPYLHDEMGAAYTIANLVISRAGASTLGEYPQLGLPAILVPYPYAWRYQKVNADYLARHGAAIVVPDAELPARLLPLVGELFGDEERLATMRKAMQSLNRPQAAQSIAALLRGLASGNEVGLHG